MRQQQFVDVKDLLVLVRRQVEVVVILAQFILRRNALVWRLLLYTSFTLSSSTRHIFADQLAVLRQTERVELLHRYKKSGLFITLHKTSNFRQHGYDHAITAVAERDHALAPLRHDVQHLHHALVRPTLHAPPSSYA